MVPNRVKSLFTNLRLGYKLLPASFSLVIAIELEEGRGFVLPNNRVWICRAFCTKTLLNYICITIIAKVFSMCWIFFVCVAPLLFFKRAPSAGHC